MGAAKKESAETGREKGCLDDHVEARVKLSIIVPVYQVEQLLDRCICSLINSQTDDYEIVLVDDGSTDRSPELCDNWAKCNPAVRVIHQPNGGLSDARNTGIKAAEGDYIAFVDSDDRLRDGAATHLLGLLEKNKGVDILALDTVKVTGSAEHRYSFQKTDGVYSGKDFLKLQYRSGKMLHQAWQNIYRREFLLEHDLFFKKGILHEDIQWTPRVFYWAKNVSYCAFPFYEYIIRPDSITTKKDTRKNLRDIMTTVRELTVFFHKQEDHELYRLVKDGLTAVYLTYYGKGYFYRCGKEFEFENRFVRKDLVKRNTKVKALIYSVNKHFFCWFTNSRFNR